jgi:hypothetical protein
MNGLRRDGIIGQEEHRERRRRRREEIPGRIGGRTDRAVVGRRADVDAWTVDGRGTVKAADWRLAKRKVTTTARESHFHHH